MQLKNLRQNTFLLLLFASLCFLPGCSADDNPPKIESVTETLIAAQHSNFIGGTTLESNRYDLWFRQSTRTYMYGVDWRLLKSQCYAESRFDPRAVSPVGAKGACQFMPATWKDVETGRKIYGDPFDAELNIDFAGYYMGKLRANWKSERPEPDRHSLAMASYNGGLGNLLKAQKKCNNKSLYDEIIHCLPQVTGNNSKETITYVERIWRFYFKLKML